ncbi:YopT family protein [Bacillus sonorensis]|uniref:YopT family protein n=1 Tax=Bacillus sonorensis TaxID=119858 RepID=UPI002281DB99|nr:YopT family protein [Bacillus sonorensis]MCY8034097.1 YopT family protein [Bacillus sonorensis]MCY8565647.1 YopT family protein [Bacillus sonorensis]
MAQQKYLNNCLLQIDTFIENSADSMKSSKDKAEFLLEKLQEAYKIVFINIDGEAEEFDICNLEYEVEDTEEWEDGHIKETDTALNQMIKI